MEKIIGQQGNARTVASGQDAKLYYFDQNNNKSAYLLNSDVNTIIKNISLQKKDENEINEEDEIKLGRFIIKAEDDALYFYLDDECIFKIDKDGINTSRLNNMRLGGVNLK